MHVGVALQNSTASANSQENCLILYIAHDDKQPLFGRDWITAFNGAPLLDILVTHFDYSTSGKIIGQLYAPQVNTIDTV